MTSVTITLRFDDVRRCLAKVILLVVTTLYPTLESKAEEQRLERLLHFSGLSYHFENTSNVNGILAGVGITWDLKKFESNGLVLAFEADVFRDSQRKAAYSIGVSLRKNFGDVSLGIYPGIAIKENLREQSDYPVYPIAVPFAEFGFSRDVRPRVLYVPPIRSSKDQQLLIQLLIRLDRD